VADISGTSGNDDLSGTGEPDTINGLGGDDTIDGDAGNDVLSGDAGNDTLQGGLDDDVLKGGDGDDWLDGGAGADQLIGGIGVDTMFAFGADIAEGGAGNDVLTVGDGLGSIFDGGTNTDTLTLDFALAASGVTASLNFLWVGLSGSIGNATVSSFEVLGGPVVGSGFADSINVGSNYGSAVTMNLGAGNDAGTGGSADDTISGGDGNDTLNGLDGNDGLSGGLGNDHLYGGFGNDTLSDSDGINTLDGGDGDDTVLLGAMTGGSADGGAGLTDLLNFDFAAAATGVTVSLNFVGGSMSGNVGGVGISGFEAMALLFNQTTQFADTITLGAAFDRAMTINLLDGNDSYSGGLGGDYVNGGAGNDTLGGGGGTNTLIGGVGNDSYVVENNTTTLSEAAGEGTDTVLASINWGLAENFENLTLTGFGNIDGYGNGAANVITGNNGNNRIEASAGDDTIHGGNGNDTLYGMEGNDAINGDGGDDNIEDNVGTNAINGGAGNDYIVFSGDAVNHADGGIGSDSLDIRYFGRTTGFVIDLTGMWSGGSGSVNGGTVTGFESLIGFEGTQWADVIDFGAGTLANAGINDARGGNDILTGSDGNNYINGGDGDDTIVSGSGMDELLGGAGNDAITVGASTTGTIDGGTGTDTLYFALGEAAAGIALDIDFTLLWSGGTGTFNGVSVTGIELLQSETIVGSFFGSVADTVVIGAGYAGDVHMSLGHGNDTVTGGSGDDTIDGGQDDDLIRGGAGNDAVGGSYGSDYVYGDAGDDLIGGDTLDLEWAWGSDHLFGGSGNDTIEGGAYGDWLYGGGGNDVMRGDSAALDQADHGSDLLKGGAGDDQLSGEGGADRLLGGAGTDTLNGDAGDDELEGGSGADTMAGGAGDDFYDLDSAGDTIAELAGDGVDRVLARLDYTLGDHVENLTLRGALAQSGTGNSLANVLRGTVGDNTLSGLGGIDELYGSDGDDTLLGGGGTDRLEGGAGRDTISGGNGDDLVVGGANKDTLTGGDGSDTFFFGVGEVGAGASSADIVIDFSQADGDKIHVRQIDANTGLGGDQNFAFIGSGAFTGVAGQIHYVQAGGNTYVEGDTDGDGSADFVIRLDGLISLVAGDVVL